MKPGGASMAAAVHRPYSCAGVLRMEFVPPLTGLHGAAQIDIAEVLQMSPLQALEPEIEGIDQDVDDGLAQFWMLDHVEARKFNGPPSQRPPSRGMT